ncbi:MAG: NAD(P)/FAD-dependent oxidoreductase [Clostridia bacterium]|nr:NAD(P)/FAD-dependent oxidoreductase [Clostridia bacterium]
MSERYDVIVVGAGNGGLVAAAKCAKEGYKTLLLEKHNLPGGCATSFRRGRFEFEPSLHELCGVGSAEHPDVLYKIFEDLDVKIDWQIDRHLFRVISPGPDGYDVTMPAGKEEFLAAMEAAVPGCKESVRAFLDLIDNINDAQVYMDGGKLNPVTLMKDYGDFLRTGCHSVDEVMEALNIPVKARNILNTYWGYLGVPSRDLNALHYISMLTSYMNEGALMPPHRSHEMSLALLASFKKNGGTVLFNSEVTRFIYTGDGSACGVRANGKDYFAREIISNIIPNNVINRSDSRFIPARSKKLANARKLGMSVATIYLGMDCTKEELGINDYSVFVVSSPDANKQYEDHKDFGMYIVNCLNEVIPDASPAGTSMLFFTTAMYPGDLPKDLTPETYKDYKNALAKKYIDHYEALTGMNIKDHIEEISVATPVTFARYLDTPDGTIYGYMATGYDNIIARTATVDADYKIPHMHFCGGHYVRGDGFAPSYTTGYMAAEETIKALKGGAVG